MTPIPPATSHQYERAQVRQAALGGAGGLFLTVVLAAGVSLCLERGFDVKGAWLWVDLFRNPPTLAKLQDQKAFEANIDRLFQLIFIFAVLVSVFSQQTISYFFRLNKFDLHSALVLKCLVYSRKERRLCVRQFGQSTPAEKFLRLTVIIVALNVIASFSIVGVGNFGFHILSTVAYLLLVLFLDLVSWLLVSERSGNNTLYGGVRPFLLFRYMNRQLIFTIDSGILIIFVIILIGAIGGYTHDPTVLEKAFFTGVVSFYLFSTCILIGYLLYEWRAILIGTSVAARGAEK